MASGMYFDEDGHDVTMDVLSQAVEEMDVQACNRCGDGPLTGSGPHRDSHLPCCSSHKMNMCCACYRTTHFVEVGPCH